MYLPKQFVEPRIEELHRIVRENSLGMLLTNTAAGLEANHLPFLLDGDQQAGGILLEILSRSGVLPFRPLLSLVR